MKVLQVNSDDLHSRRFGGYDLLSGLEPRGIHGKQAVLYKLSTDPDVVPLLGSPLDRALHDSLAYAEQQYSMNDLLYPWGRVLEETPQFKNADVVHYHLIHNQVISLFDLPRLFASKPSVWTFHDPWPLTGHCIHPQQCQGWLAGCDPCPYLDRVFAMERDRAAAMWRIKQRLYTDMDVDIVVASEFMADLVGRSPLTSHLERVHLIPFGIDAARFLPDSEKAASRRSLGIPEDDLVLLFRSKTFDLKGLREIVDALSSKPPQRSTTLLTVDTTGLLSELSPAYKVLDLGWVEDEDLYARALSACDMLLMPSKAEAFGLMAVEAMAAGRPVVCFEGTALPSVTHAPECGIAVPMGDALALRAAIDALADDPDDAARRGRLGRELAAEHYNHERYLDDIAALYHSAQEHPRVVAE